SGGNSSAAAKNKASHREGLRRVHQRSGAITAGAASRAFERGAGASAIAAAHTPNTSGSHQRGRGSDALFMGRKAPPRWDRPSTFVVCLASPNDGGMT